MSEHQRTRDLLGPYVMGDLPAEEERTVEEHLENCSSCAGEADSLRLAHERLVEFAAVAETPPPHLKERALGGMPGPVPRPAERRIPPWMAAAAALLLALGVAYGASLLGGGGVAAATLEPMGEAPEAGAEVNVQGSGENLEVSVDAWGLPPCEREEYYELWFVEESGEHVSAGSFTVGESGDAELDLTAPQFATSYQRIGVTVERDKDPRPSGVMMMGGELRES
jgi:anti-sigma-K factor RskA